MVIIKKENEEGEFIMEDQVPMPNFIPHPKDWADSLPDLKRRNADLDKRDSLSWANQSPYTSRIHTYDKDFLRDFGVSVSPEQAVELRRYQTSGYSYSEYLKQKGVQVSVVTTLPSVLKRQEAGNHYKDGTIQPIEFITSNNLSFVIGNIIKYAYRADKKGGAEDLRKCLHYCQIELETKYGIRSEVKYEH